MVYLARGKVTPFADALVYVMSQGANTAGKCGRQRRHAELHAGAMGPLADWNPSVYDLVAAADLASNRYKTATFDGCHYG